MSHLNQKYTYFLLKNAFLSSIMKQKLQKYLRIRYSRTFILDKIFDEVITDLAHVMDLKWSYFLLVELYPLVVALGFCCL